MQNSSLQRLISATILALCLGFEPGMDETAPASWTIKPVGTAFAQSAETPDIEAQEQWLRYSNRQLHSQKHSSPRAKVDAGSPAVLHDPNVRPGAQSVESSVIAVPAWSTGTDSSQSRQIPGQIFVGGGEPSIDGTFFGSPFVYPGILPNQAPFGYFPGNRNGWLRGRVGTQVIQTGPSPSSGNYYQPSTAAPGSSGSYYASGKPWQLPAQIQNTPKDYWGPDGDPFQSQK